MGMPRRLALFALPAGLAVLVACGAESPAATAPTATAPSAGPGTQAPAVAPRQATRERQASVSRSSFDAPLDAPAVVAVRDAFAASAGLAPDEVVVTGIEAVTWPDSSLGCGQPDQMYLQVLTPGYRISLAGPGAHATYHTDRGEGAAVRYARCDQGPGRLDIEQVGSPALDRVRQDLEGRLPPGKAIAHEGTMVAPVTQLACDADMPSEAPSGPARVILEFHLRAGDDVHVYRAWGDDLVYCGLEGAPITE